MKLLLILLAPFYQQNSDCQIKIKSFFQGNVVYRYTSQSIPKFILKDLELINTKIGYRTLVFKSFSLHTFFGIQNILDQKYASQLQVNASSFNGSVPRYFY